MTGLGLGVLDLAVGLRALQSRFGLETVSATKRVPDGHSITMRWSGGALELEREDGEWMPLNSDGVR